jgi:hypothetical protein
MGLSSSIYVGRYDGMKGDRFEWGLLAECILAETDVYCSAIWGKSDYGVSILIIGNND